MFKIKILFKKLVSQVGIVQVEKFIFVMKIKVRN